ncbi:MAG TPA: hypothetical protein VIF62_20325 [Labilithrix sp.]
MRKTVATFVVFCPVVAIAAACSSSSSSNSSPPCNQEPFQCAAGTTCWSKDGATFACEPSGPGAYGDACTPAAGASSPCGDGLICLQTTNAGGKCVHLCSQTDPAHGCATGTCTAAAFGSASGPITYVCAGGTGPTDAGGG